MYRTDGYLMSASEFNAAVNTGKLTGGVSTPNEPFSVCFHDLGFSSLRPGLADALVEAIEQSPLFMAEHMYDIRENGLNKTARIVFTRCWMLLLGTE